MAWVAVASLITFPYPVKAKLSTVRGPPVSCCIIFLVRELFLMKLKSTLRHGFTGAEQGRNLALVCSRWVQHMLQTAIDHWSSFPQHVRLVLRDGVGVFCLGATRARIMRQLFASVHVLRTHRWNLSQPRVKHVSNDHVCIAFHLDPFQILCP